MPLFSRLRTKLTVLYAGLFAVTLILISAAVYTAISSNAVRVVREELTASGTVFDRIWALRTEQLENGAGLLSRDFGFRSAVATGDEATIGSALDNLKVRLGIDLAFVIGADGRVRAATGDRAVSAVPPTMLSALQGDDVASGVVMIGSTPYQAVSVPVMAPTALGWVVFAAKLDSGQMKALERLSAIPLKASVLARAPSGAWSAADRSVQTVGKDRINDFINRSISARDAAAQALATVDGPAIALVKPLPSIGAGAPAVLLLQYPMATAMAPYRFLVAILIVVGVAGAGLLVLGSWALARSVTRPISALEDAARRLQRGERATVAVTTNDEIARLADSFNVMAAEIGERERRITHLAHHDPDTDLPNHYAFDLALAKRLAGDGAQRVHVAVLGVDRFAHVRGAIGYRLAGALIGELGHRLRRRHPELQVGRLATDAIGVVFEAYDLNQAKEFTGELQALLEEPMLLADNTIDVNLTVGLAAHAAQTDQARSLVERANIAVDQARAARQKIAVFDKAVYGDPAANLSLMSEMRRSILGGDMILHHQPKYDLRRGAVTGVEALVRWNHPIRGLTGPDEFIGMAEETGHIRALTDWVLGQALADQQAMRAAGHPLSVSVNISGRQLDDTEFADRAIEAIAQAGGDICFEITETAVIENPELAFSLIDRFAAAGVAISIDDYGAGLSSLAYLKMIRANELKIDKSFVFSMADSQRDALLVRSTIDLAHSLGLKVTAEGVETPTALALLSGMGCDVAQGYLIARPMPLNKLLMFMAEEKRVAKTYG